MCTLALYFQELENFPLVVAANRDEHFSRPSAPPQPLLEAPLVFGGKDLRAGGTWLGVNQNGLVVGTLNRRSHGDEKLSAKRSRGLLCLDILRLKNPTEACALLKRETGSDYQPFNLLFASQEKAYVAYNVGEEIAFVGLDKGLHVLSNSAIYDARTEKMDQAYHLFSSLRKKLERDSRPSSWIKPLKEALSDHSLPRHSSEPKDAICVHTDSYGTVSSSIIIYACKERRFYSFYAPGAPCREVYGEPATIDVS